MSKDAKKPQSNVIEMPDIYGEKSVVQDETVKPIEAEDSKIEDSGDFEGFDPYDTARLYKDKIQSSKS